MARIVAWVSGSDITRWNVPWAASGCSASVTAASATYSSGTMLNGAWGAPGTLRTRFTRAPSDATWARRRTVEKRMFVRRDAARRLGCRTYDDARPQHAEVDAVQGRRVHQLELRLELGPFIGIVERLTDVAIVFEHASTSTSAHERGRDVRERSKATAGKSLEKQYRSPDVHAVKRGKVIDEEPSIAGAMDDGCDVVAKPGEVRRLGGIESGQVDGHDGQAPLGGRPPHRGVKARDRRLPGLRSSQSDHVASLAEETADDLATDEAGGAGDEHRSVGTHHPSLGTRPAGQGLPGTRSAGQRHRPA